MTFARFKKLELLHEELFKRGKKLCTRCLELKTLKEFYKLKSVRLGYRPMCSKCELEYYHKKSRAYRLKHKTKNSAFKIINT